MSSKHSRFIATAIEAAKKELGSAWDLLGPKVQEAFVCKHALITLAARDGVVEWQQAADFSQEALDALS
jgi:hypothetical protein